METEPLKGDFTRWTHGETVGREQRRYDMNFVDADFISILRYFLRKTADYFPSNFSSIHLKLSYYALVTCGKIVYRLSQSPSSTRGLGMSRTKDFSSLQRANFYRPKNGSVNKLQPRPIRIEIAKKLSFKCKSMLLHASFLSGRGHDFTR